MLIPKIQNFQYNITSNTVSFKGEFDKYAFISEKIQKTRMAAQKSNYEYGRRRLDREISQVDNQLSSLRGQIRSLKSTINLNDSRISSLKNESQDLLNIIEKNKKTIKNYTEENLELVQKYLDQKKQIDNEIQKEIIKNAVAQKQKFMEDSEYIRTGQRAQLIEKVVNPLINSNILSEDFLANTVLNCETLSAFEMKQVKNTIFKWVIGKTGANYAELNVNSYYNNPNEFVNILRKISLLAYKDFEQNGNYSVTCIDNLSSLNKKLLNKNNKKFLDQVLSDSNRLYHNMLLIFSTKQDVSLSNVNEITLNSQYMNDVRVGLASMVKDNVKQYHYGIDLVRKLVK